MNKICTSIEQSKKLIELGIDVNSADMFYRNNGIDVKLMWEHNAPKVKYPCWSLAALLELIRNFQPNNLGALFVGKEDGYQYMSGIYLATHEHNNPIDACVGMIEKLHEQNLL